MTDIWGTTPPAAGSFEPECVADPISLDEVFTTFARWLGDGYDLGSLSAVLAVAAVSHLDGDAPGLLVVSGSGNAKTETVSALTGCGANVTSTITSEGALLSATSRKERTQDATGGLLRKIGDTGILVIKDVTSILSMNRDARNAVLGALREVADGYWERNVGTDGGKTLTWAGRIVMIGAVTTAWDSHHSVIATMGDRFLLYRSDSAAGPARRLSGRRSIQNIGSEVQMRAELSDAVRRLMDSLRTDGLELSREDIETLLGLADLVTIARTAVERDQRGDIIDAHAPEAPTRLVKYLGQLLRGSLAIGLDHDQALDLCRRVAHDCVPPIRLAVLADVLNGPARTTTQIAKSLQRPRQSVDRTLQELVALRLVDIAEQPQRNGWIYSVNPELDANDLAELVSVSKTVTRKVTTSTQGHRGKERQTKPAKTLVHASTDIPGDDPTPMTSKLVTACSTCGVQTVVNPCRDCEQGAA